MGRQRPTWALFLRPKYTTFAHVSHPNVRPMQYANPMLGQLMGMA